jgi:ketosteroid isomerase-like protein
MSQESVNRVREGYEAFSRGDIDAAVAGFHPDIEWIAWDALPDGGTVHGRDGVREFFRSWRESFGDISVEAEEVFDAGETVVVVTRVRGQVRGSSAEVVTPSVPWVWTIRDGQAVRMEMFPNKAAAFEALGLSDPTPAAPAPD